MHFNLRCALQVVCGTPSFENSVRKSAISCASLVPVSCSGVCVGVCVCGFVFVSCVLCGCVVLPVVAVVVVVVVCCGCCCRCCL